MTASTITPLSVRDGLVRDREREREFSRNNNAGDRRRLERKYLRQSMTSVSHVWSTLSALLSSIENTFDVLLSAQLSALLSLLPFSQWRFVPVEKSPIGDLQA